MPTPSPFELWKQARADYPDDAEAHRARYLELMRQYGHIVETKPGEDRNLPCGWPGNRRG